MSPAEFGSCPLTKASIDNTSFQGSCRVSRVFYAAISSAGCSLSGLSVTGPMGCQFRVAPVFNTGNIHAAQLAGNLLGRKVPAQ